LVGVDRETSPPGIQLIEFTHHIGFVLPKQPVSNLNLYYFMTRPLAISRMRDRAARPGFGCTLGLLRRHRRRRGDAFLAGWLALGPTKSI
jgi:hypothetical protein